MSIEALKACKADYGRREGRKTVAAKLLNGHLPQILIHTQATICRCIAVGRQDVVGTAAIVADRFWCPLPDKYGPRVADIGDSSSGIFDL